MRVNPIIKFLQYLGINAVFSDRNDIIANGYKISGNAEHIIKNRVIHHGTLLFNSNLKKLTKSLDSNKNRIIKTRAIKSTKSKVVNISELLKNKISINEFQLSLIKFIKNIISFEEIALRNETIKKIEQLSIDKYKTWKWNYAYSPEFSIIIKDSIEIIVVKGYIVSINKLSNNYNSYNNLKQILINKKYEYENLKSILNYYNKKQSKDFQLFITELF